jgi:hypothetical protein
MEKEELKSWEKDGSEVTECITATNMAAAAAAACARSALAATGHRSLGQGYHPCHNCSIVIAWTNNSSHGLV